MAKRDFPPAPWRHPHPVTRVAGTITLAVLAVLAVAVCSGLVYGLVKFLGRFL